MTQEPGGGIVNPDKLQFVKELGAGCKLCQRATEKCSDNREKTRSVFES